MEKEFNVLMPHAEILNPYGVAFRYPDDYFVPDRDEVVEAIESAHKILMFVRDKILWVGEKNISLF